MQGLIFDIQHCTIHDGPGIRTTVFFKGCPLRCQWCHNPEGLAGEIQEIVKAKQVASHTFHENTQIGRYITEDELMEILLRDMIFYEESNGGVTFSGGEPLDQGEFLSRMLQRCKKQGLHTTLDTSGHGNPEILTLVLKYVDLVLFDIKLLNEVHHKQYTGISNKIILNNLNIVLSEGKKVIIRYPLIPGINNSPEQLAELDAFLWGRVNELHFLPYHSIAAYKYAQFGLGYKLEDVKGPEEDYLGLLKEEFTKKGYTIKIGG